MPLDPQLERYRARREQRRVTPLYELSLTQARAEDLRSIQDAAGDPEPVAHLDDHVIPGPGGPLDLRVYRPVESAEPAPVLVYLFGGGWTLGTIDTADAICRRLANAVGCVVVAAGYRLAPEHKFPAAVHDCHAAVRWVAEHADELGVDPGRLAVGGDSAGGNLAAVVSLLARTEGPPIAHQLLVYPNTEYNSDTPSLRENSDRYLFNHHSVAWYWDNYLADPADGADPLASPLRAADLAGLPPATVITAEYDPLRDEGERYAERLRAAGVPTELTRFPGMAHGFFAMFGELPAAAAAVETAAARLRTAFGTEVAR
ncbi:alpha/beta hydrolase [Actinokineospora sp. NBRC 105648]|uniref:alpha/beta hydrolase n=1 Tax=Actinokineospora sp. NBRC 105648 TaxID=3032206 RepID=UPI0024A2462C|nr:alpha/beta hydrolase [Actinokineospora sp. NBRC 105648]GLZ39792.1 acetylhydrolase [Actinokineospora sp. NBRC 105648]